MNIEAIFWAVLAVFTVAAAVAFGIGFRLGRTKSEKGAGVGVGIAILAIMAVVFGGAKAAEGKIGPLIAYEGAWFSSALNFALVGGYIAGKIRSDASASKRALPVLCAIIALASLYMMGARLHQFVDVLQTLGVGKARTKLAGPDTSLDCGKSLTEVYKGFKHYAELNDALPPAAKWIDEEDLRGQVQADEWFHCPTVSTRKDDKYGYAYNDALAGRKLNGKGLKDMPDAAKTPLVFDSTAQAKNAHDPVTSLPKPGRHGGKNNILYCDGHIEAVAPK